MRKNVKLTLSETIANSICFIVSHASNVSKTRFQRIDSPKILLRFFSAMVFITTEWRLLASAEFASYSSQCLRHADCANLGDFCSASQCISPTTGRTYRCGFCRCDCPPNHCSVDFTNRTFLESKKVSPRDYRPSTPNLYNPARIFAGLLLMNIFGFC